MYTISCYFMVVSQTSVAVIMIAPPSPPRQTCAERRSARRGLVLSSLWGAPQWDPTSMLADADILDDDVVDEGLPLPCR